MASFSLYQSGPLFAFTRKGIPEVVVQGTALMKTQGAAMYSPDQGLLCVLRTLLKPWQFLAADSFGTEPFWAMGLATHSGQAMHLEALMKLREAADAEENDFADERIGPELESETSHLGLVVDDSLDFFAIAVLPLHRRNVDRARKVINDAVD